jgi:hypothetical protein
VDKPINASLQLAKPKLEMILDAKGRFVIKP